MGKDREISYAMGAGRVFVNIFGYHLGELESSEAKIYNKDNVVIGILRIEKNKVKIECKCGYDILKAEYNVPKINLGFSWKYWINEINFKVKNTEHTYEGVFLIEGTNYTKKGEQFTIRGKIDCLDAKSQKISMIFNDETNLFWCCKQVNNHKETYIISPKGKSLYCHDRIISDLFAEDDFLYREYSGVFRNKQNNEESFRLFSQELDCKKSLGGKRTMKNEVIMPEKIPDEKYGNYKQKANLMNLVKPIFFKNVRDLKNEMIFNGESIINNFICLCGNSYSNEDLSIIMGFEVEPVVFQGKTCDVVEAYNNNQEEQVVKKENRLLKRVRNKKTD